MNRGGAARWATLGRQWASGFRRRLSSRPDFALKFSEGEEKTASTPDVLLQCLGSEEREVTRGSALCRAERLWQISPLHGR